LSAYGNFISNTADGMTTGDPVTLNTSLNETPVGMTFAGDTPTVTVTVPGVYRIDYRVSVASGTGAVVSLLQNGTAITGSSINVLANNSTVSGVAVVPLVADNTIAIGTSGVAVTLAGGTNAFLNIMRIA